MVNRECDFCCNLYRVNPNVGYFRVTRVMLAALGLDSQGCIQRDFICGLHFGDDCFKEDGKLKFGSIPTFFPVLESAVHDHNYHQIRTDDSTDYDGGIFENIFYHLNENYIWKGFESIPPSQTGQFEEDSEVYSEEIQDDPNDITYIPSDSPSTSEQETPEIETGSYSNSQVRRIKPKSHHTRISYYRM